VASATYLPSKAELDERDRRRVADTAPVEAPAAPVAPAPVTANSAPGVGGGANVAPRVKAFTDKSTARKMVLASMFALLAISVYRSKQPQNDVNLYRRVWGTAVLGLFLSIMADFVPTIAGPFAVLTVLGALTNGGDAAIQNALSGLSSKLPTASSTGTATATATTTTSQGSASPTPTPQSTTPGVNAANAPGYPSVPVAQVQK
jgi:hypothetical protein